MWLKITELVNVQTKSIPQGLKLKWHMVESNCIPSFHSHCWVNCLPFSPAMSLSELLVSEAHWLTFKRLRSWYVIIFTWEILKSFWIIFFIKKVVTNFHPFNIWKCQHKGSNNFVSKIDSLEMLMKTPSIQLLKTFSF